MYKYRVAICEPDTHYQVQIQNELQLITKKEKIRFQVRNYLSGKELIAKLKKYKPQIAILAYELGDLNGLQVAEYLNKNCTNICIIMITFHERFALQAYENGLLGYLLKPLNQTLFEVYIKRAVILVKNYLLNLSSASSEITFKSGKQNITIDKQNIIYIEKFRNYINVVTKKGEYRSLGSLCTILENLMGDGFMFSHQGYIINLKLITRIERDEVYFCDSISVPVSRRSYYSLVQNYIDFNSRQRQLK